MMKILLDLLVNTTHVDKGDMYICVLVVRAYLDGVVHVHYRFCYVKGVE